MTSPGPPDGGSPWPPTDETVRSARDGDGRALAEILVAGYPRLVAFYRGVGLSPSDAEDLASETTEGVIRNLSGLRESGAFEGWFWAVARNRLRSRFRTLRRVTVELAYPLVPDPVDVAVEAEEHAIIAAALARLAPRDRAILWLREVEGLDYDEIGRSMSLAGPTVRVAALRARRRLEEAYRSLDGTGSEAAHRRHAPS